MWTMCRHWMYSFLLYSYIISIVTFQIKILVYKTYKDLIKYCNKRAMNATNLLVLPRWEGVWRLRGLSNAPHGQGHWGRTLSVHHEDLALRPRGQVWIPTLHPREGWHTWGRSEFGLTFFSFVFCHFGQTYSCMKPLFSFPFWILLFRTSLLNLSERVLEVFLLCYKPEPFTTYST